MNTPEEEQILIDAVSTAWRARDSDEKIQWHPAWFDLDEAGRDKAFEATLGLRRMEAALDESGLSTTAQAVLARIRQA